MVEDKNKNSKNTASPTISDFSLREFGSRKSSLTFETALKAGKPSRVFDSGTEVLYRQGNRRLSSLVAGESLKTRQHNVAHAWLHGLVTIRIPKGKRVPSKLFKSFMRLDPENLILKKLPSVKESRGIISTLHENKIRCVNVFGSLADSCRAGNPVMYLIMRLASYNSEPTGMSRCRHVKTT